LKGEGKPEGSPQADSQSDRPIDRAIAYPVNFNGPSTYLKSFKGTDFGVVFEDDGATGYFYATNKKADKIFDALHLYDEKSRDGLRPGDDVFIVWNPKLTRVGLFYHGRFHAIVDFKNRSSCCRSGFPARVGKWCKTSHEWNEDMANGLQSRGSI